MRDTLYLLGFLFVGALLLFIGRDQLPFSTILTWVLTFGAATAVGILVVSLYRVQNELQASRHELARKDAELNFAREVQAALFPQELPKNRGLSFSAICIPAQGISGDYYDIVEQADGRIVIALADISGKGISAAILMANLQARFRALSESQPDLAQLCKTLNQHLHDITEPEKFATFLVAQWRPGSLFIEYVNAGHEPPVLITGEEQKMDLGGPPLGLFPNIEYDSGRVQLKRADLLVLFSDGITEAQNSEEKEFGLARLHKLVEAEKEHSVREIQAAILDRVNRWTRDEPQDDMTLVIVRVENELALAKASSGEEIGQEEKV